MTTTTSEDMPDPDGLTLAIETTFGVEFDFDQADDDGTETAAYEALEQLFDVVIYTASRFILLAEAIGYETDELCDAFDEHALDAVAETHTLIDHMRDEIDAFDENVSIEVD